MDKEKNLLTNEPEDDMWAGFFDEDDEYPDFDENEMIDRFDREMREALEKTAAEIREKEETTEYYQPEPEKKRYEYYDLTFDEALGYVAVNKPDGSKKIYHISTEEERKAAKAIHSLDASHAVSTMLLSLTAVPAAMFFNELYESSGLKSLLIMLGLSAPAAFVFSFFISAVSGVIVYLFKLENDVKKDKMIKPAIVSYIVWVLIVIAVIVIMPSINTIS